MYNPQETYSRIKSLIKIRKTSIGAINEYANLSENTISQSAKGQDGMKARNLFAIAEFLECSVDYLLGRTNDPLSHKERSATLSVGNDFNNKGFIGNIGNNNSQLATNSVNTLDENDLAILSIYKELPPFERAKLMVYANDLKGGANEI